ncbi:L-Ala-D/L-Glu epimerase [Aquimixticola soesokkakensis]|uniref:L-Ala-D/L-Glu epimerase n=1 Tax=Aquimixticola soesokkakensis TaxID=1519096 RepID=A0A1Y5S0R8_9RHOB|nr:enolase C-terminal domain-like protein [Aquimixticola soesokkakensis]SLN27016.1 L-Ala-D/L-Glu epimerase [Aquimixticola soesokkakensis]
MRLTFHRAQLHYAGLTLHTASSGAIAALDTLYLVLSPQDGCEAIGEVRLNCAYLNGYGAQDLIDRARDLANRLPWHKPPRALREGIAASGAPAPVRALFDTALWDLEARRAGKPLAAYLAAYLAAHLARDSALDPDACALPLARGTNQTLFLSEDADFMAQAEGYVARGFHDLKIRFGADFDADLARLAALRDRFGPDLVLAIDVNGAWQADVAAERLQRLAPLALKYVEQPIAAGDWSAMVALAKAAPMPLMLDESMASAQDLHQIVTQFDASGRKLWAHLKLIKTGGLTPALAAVRQLEAAGVPYMIGQMNEGGLATAAAAHLALATSPVAAELYGADGLIDDPASGLTYAQGQIALPQAAGLGLPFDKRRAPRMMEN